MSDSASPNAVAVQDRFPALIGDLNIAWNRAMFGVYVIFVRLLHGDLIRAQAIFFALKNDSAQRDITAAVGAAILKFATPQGLGDELNTILNKMGQLAGRRNDAIHSMWNFDLERDAPEVYQPSRPRLHGENVESIFRATIVDILNTAICLSALAEKIEAAQIPLLSVYLPSGGAKTASSEEPSRST